MTEEFHPGFRNSTAAYTVGLLQPKDHPRPEAARAWVAHRQRRAQNFLPLPDGRYLLTGEGRTGARDRKIQRQGCRSLYRLSVRDRAASLTCFAASCSTPRPIWYCGSFSHTMGELGKLAAIAKRLWRAERPQGGVRSVSQISRRHARRLVRIRSDQGGARLRCGRGQLGEPIYTGLRLCAAASRVPAR